MLNEEAFRTKMRNNTAIINKILGIFITKYGDDVQELQTLVNNGDMEKVYHFAHSLKGVFANLCADEEAELAGKIEQQSKQGDTPDPDLITEMIDRISKTNAQIHNILSN